MVRRKRLKSVDLINQTVLKRIKEIKADIIQHGITVEFERI